MLLRNNKMRLALFISGGGTTAQAIIKACFSGKLDIEPVLVVASRAKIKGIQRVYEAGISKDKIIVLDPKKFKTTDDFAGSLIGECTSRKVDLVGQYGWLPLTPKKFVDAFKGRIINQHPGPLDPPRADFGGKGMYGRRVHCAVLYFRRMTNRDFWTEAVTHFVTFEFDKGEIIKRKKINILSTDTVEDLQERVLSVEHQVQIEALDDFVKNKVNPIRRSKPLINKNEYKILEQAKKTASVLYPYG